MNQSANESLQEALDKRKEKSLYRCLQPENDFADFCSNDYLSFSRSAIAHSALSSYGQSVTRLNGATGSRSISGNTSCAEQLEQMLADFHHAEAGLIFNSGYDANLGLFSCIAGKNDTLISDELIHASIIDGSRLSYATRYRFAHNDVDDLIRKLKIAGQNSGTPGGQIFVAVESVYSMDGDMAPLQEIAALCKRYQANMIVDEAHATGVFGRQGRGVVNHYGLEDQVFARIHTFGKAIGAHGAIIVGSNVLRNYLINFARSFIFTTALPVHSLIAVRCAYERLMNEDFSTEHLHQLIALFKERFPFNKDIYLVESNSPVQSLIIPGNERAKAISQQLQDRGLDVRAILSPSVPAGKERLRISLHMHNTFEEVERLKQALNELLEQ